jgi:hypothetical protein
MNVHEDHEQQNQQTSADVQKHLAVSNTNNDGYECFTTSNLVAAGKALQHQHRNNSFSDDSATSIYAESWLCSTFECT